MWEASMSHNPMDPACYGDSFCTQTFKSRLLEPPSERKQDIEADMNLIIFFI
jgi:hypothetical protein